MHASTKVALGAVAVASSAVVAERIGSARHAARVAKDVERLLAVPTGGPPLEPTALPPVVARYRHVAVDDRLPVTVARMQHGGTFQPSPSSKAYPIQGEQIFTASPPGFVWSASIHAGPGLRFDARDESIDGVGEMRVLVDALVPVVDAHGPALDEGALLRVLAEMPWFPTALFDARFVTWTAIDDTHARATLRLHDRAVSADFTFEHDLPVRCDAERPNDHGVRLPWGGVYRDYRTTSGLVVPFEADVSWQLPSGPFTYARWRIESLEYETGPLFTYDIGSPR